MDVKRCFKCERDLPVSEFYRHAQMVDGRLGKCRDCTRADVKRHRALNVDRIRAIERERAQQPKAIEQRKRTVARWRKEHPDRVSAHNAAARAGLVAPALCEGCNLDRRLEKHHPDYSRPLLVAWLCKPCHAIADKIRRLTEAA